MKCYITTIYFPDNWSEKYNRETVTKNEISEQVARKILNNIYVPFPSKGGAICIERKHERGMEITTNLHIEIA